MYDVTPFEFQGHEIRTVQHDDGSVWFVAKDVCDAIGLTNSRDTLSRVPDCHKATVDWIDTAGRPNRLQIIDEPGMYRVVLRSDKPAAEPLMEKVTKEVLPALRKHGVYVDDSRKNTTVAIVSAPKPITIAKLKTEWKAALAFAQTFGVDGNQAMLMADKIIRNQYGVSPLLIADMQLQSPQPTRLLTATDVGSLLEPRLSAKAVNDVLFNMTFQTSSRDTKGHLHYEPTDLGKPYAVMCDVPKGPANPNGASVRQLKWEKGVVAKIQDFMDLKGV